MSKSKCPECKKTVPLHYNFTSYSGVFCDEKCCEAYEGKHKESDFIYVKALEKGYTKQDFIYLDKEEEKEFVEALTPSELAELHQKVKYAYSDEVSTKFDAVVSFLALQ